MFVNEQIKLKVDALRKTGLNAEEACKQVGVNVATYYYWHNKMNKEASVKTVTVKKKKKVESPEQPYKVLPIISNDTHELKGSPEAWARFIHTIGNLTNRGVQ